MEKLRLRTSARKDSERIEKLVYEYYYDLVPVLDGFQKEEETVCKKIVDKEGNIIAGCTGYIYPWGCMYVDDKDLRIYSRATEQTLIPIGEEGLKATMALKKLGIKVLMTAIFTPAQALIAAKAGADYVAPYVNRLDNIIGDGTEVVAQIAEQFAIHDLPCKVLAASFKNAEQVHKCAAVGCQCVTVSADIMKAVISHPMTDAAVAGFEKDWKGVYGEKTILDF